MNKVDIFLMDEPPYNTQELLSKELQLALALSIAGNASLKSLGKKSFSEQREKLAGLKIQIATREDVIKTYVFMDTIKKTYTTVDCADECKRSDGKGLFWHVLVDEDKVPAEGLRFKDAPSYMKNLDGSPIHEFLGRPLPEPESTKDIDA